MSQKKPSVMQEVLAAMIGQDKSAERSAPKLGPELASLLRQGREDLLNNILPAFPQAGLVREPGTPGNPTMQQVTEKLEGREVNGQDRLGVMAKGLVTQQEVDQEKARAREQDRGLSR